MKFKISAPGAQLLFLAFVVFACGAANATLAQKIGEEIIVGTIENIDDAAKTVAVKTGDGAVKVYKWTTKSAAHGIKKAAVFADREAHGGAHVVLHSARIADVDTVKSLRWFGHGTLTVVD